MNGRSGLACGLLLALASPLAARQSQEAAPTRLAVHVERATSPVTIDGVLDEAAWEHAAVVPLKFETRPKENLPPDVATETLLTYDDDNLYVGFRAHDPQPSAIRAHLVDRDKAFDDDFVGIVLDTFNDERRGFEFFVNPLGVQMDLFMDDVNGNEDATWDAIWRSAGKITATGYVVEVAIPWSSLRFPHTEGEQTWGFDALRFYPRSQRARISDHPLDRNVSCYLCQEAKMSGFSGITPGKNLELTPTATASRTDRRQDFPQGSLAAGDVRSELGATGKWGITPNLTLNAAVNPDFSQVEADTAQLDVNTQFALFFPEKRPFFLEGADFFSTPFNAVFSRNVADPSWGVKLTGKAGKNALGVFAARDDRTNLLFPGSNGSSAASLDSETDDAVLRYRRDVGRSGAIGVLFTGREGEDYGNDLAGIDGRYRVGDSGVIRAQFLHSRTEYPAAISEDFGQPSGTRQDHAYWLSYDHNTRDWFGYARYEDVGRDFRADLGFMPQVDYTYMLAGFGHVWNGDWRGYTRASLGGEWDRRVDQSGNLLEKKWEFSSEINGPRQSFLLLDTGWRDTVFNNVTFFERFSRIYYETQPTGDLYLSLNLRAADQVDFANTRAGDLVEIDPTVRYSLGRHLRATLSHVYQKLDVKGGNLFTANLTQLSTVYQFNVRSFLRAILQYTDIERTPSLFLSPVDKRTETLFTQLLFSYKLNPQTVLFVGYSDDSLGDERIDLTRADRTLFLKIGYAWVP